MKKYLLIISIIISNILYSENNILLYCPNWGNAFGANIYKYNGDLICTNRDQCRTFLFKLKECCEKLNYNLLQIDSLDNLNNLNFDYLICYDINPWEISKLSIFPKEKLILYIWEPPTVKPNNYFYDVHRCFSKVFTLLDELVDNKLYYKFFETQPTLNFIEDNPPFESRKFCTLLCANKRSYHPDELYSKRLEWINFCENNNVEEFEFYGMDWDKTRYKNYKGFTWSKLDTFTKFKFAICYENMKNLNGYITAEKILYCFISGCIPVYWGPKNINKYIPSNCYIDGSKFQNPEELYKYLKKITKQEFEEYQNNIKKFLITPEAFKFSWENFVDIFCKHLIPNYNRQLIFNEKQIELLKQINAEV